MSLELALARISQIESAFNPAATSSAAGPPSGGAAVAAPTATSDLGAGTASNTFAGQLQQALAPGAAADQPGAAAAEAGLYLPAPGGASIAAPLSAVSGASTPAQAMVQIAEGEVGQAEQPPGSNDSARIATYRTATAGAQAGEPWCAYFASWVARQAGEPIGAQGQGLGYVGDIWSWAQSTGRAIPNGPGVTPSPGDLIVFGDHHVGIVERVLPGGSVQTIEGNYSNQVSRVIRGAGEASGYVRL